MNTSKRLETPIGIRRLAAASSVGAALLLGFGLGMEQMDASTNYPTSRGEGIVYEVAACLGADALVLSAVCFAYRKEGLTPAIEQPTGLVGETTEPIDDEDGWVTSSSSEPATDDLFAYAYAAA